MSRLPGGKSAQQPLLVLFVVVLPAACEYVRQHLGHEGEEHHLRRAQRQRRQRAERLLPALRHGEALERPLQQIPLHVAQLRHEAEHEKLPPVGYLVAEENGLLRNVAGGEGGADGVVGSLHGVSVGKPLREALLVAGLPDDG